MVKNLTTRGRKMVVVVDPHLKKVEDYKVYTDARDKDLLIKDKSGKEYEGWCWPGNT